MSPRAKKDGGDFAPHPGDPWHPSWTPASEGGDPAPDDFLVGVAEASSETNGSVQSLYDSLSREVNGTEPIVSADRREEIEREIRTAIEAEQAEARLTEAHQVERSRLEEARRAAEAVARRAAEEQARVAAERAAAEHEARRATERAAELESRHAAERLAAEHAAREAAEEEVRRVTERLAAEEAARKAAEEQMRDAVASAARQAAELAVEQAVKETKARLAAEEAARALAEEEARAAADRLVAAQNAAQLEAQEAAERLAAEAMARQEAEAAVEQARLKAEEAAEAAQRTAEQAAEIAAAEEASRKAAQEEARLTSLKLAAEEQARIAAEEAAEAARVERELATVEASRQAEVKEQARLEAEKRVTLIGSQLAAEQAARRRAEQDALEATAEVDQQRKFVDAIRQEELRLAEAREQERQARLSAEEQAARARRDAAKAAQLAREADKARKLAEEQARVVAERLVALEAAMADAEKTTAEAKRRAEEEARRREAEEAARISAEDKARIATAERRAAEELIKAATQDVARGASVQDAEAAARAAERAARQAAEEQQRLATERRQAEEAARLAAHAAREAALRLEAEDQARRDAEEARRLADSEARRARLASEQQQARLKSAEAAALAALRDAPTLAREREAQKQRAQQRLAIEAARPKTAEPVKVVAAPKAPMAAEVPAAAAPPIAPEVAASTSAEIASVTHLAPYRPAQVRADAKPALVDPLPAAAGAAAVQAAAAVDALDWWWEAEDNEPDLAAAWLESPLEPAAQRDSGRKWWQFWRRDNSVPVFAVDAVPVKPLADLDAAVAAIAGELESPARATRVATPTSLHRIEAVRAALDAGYLQRARAPLANSVRNFNSVHRAEAYEALWGEAEAQPAPPPALPMMLASQGRQEAFESAIRDGYLGQPASAAATPPPVAIPVSIDRLFAFDDALRAGTWPLAAPTRSVIDLNEIERESSSTGIDVMALLDPEVRDSVMWLDDEDGDVSVSTSADTDNDTPRDDGGSGGGFSPAPPVRSRERVPAGVGAASAGGSGSSTQTVIEPAISAWMSHTAAIDRVAVGAAASSGSWLQRLFSKRFQGLGLAVDVGAGLGETDLVRVVRLAAATPGEDVPTNTPQPVVVPMETEGPQAVQIPEFGIQAPLPVDFGGDDDGWVPEPDDAAYGWLDDDEGVSEWDNAPEDMSETPPTGDYELEPSPPVADEVSDATPVVPLPVAPEPESDYDVLFGDVAGEDVLEEDPAWDGPEPDFSGFTAERYVSSSTAEHVGLADAMAQAASQEPTELMALSADIPGLERGLVGLEDMHDLDSTGETVERTASDLPARVATGLGLVALVVLGLWSGPLGFGALIVVVMGIAASEYFVSLRKTGLEPITVIGLLGVGFALVGSAVWGLVTIPVAILLTAVAALIGLTLMPERGRPLVNVALTVLGVAWIGGLGGFAMDMLDESEFRWLVLATVMVTALLDVGSYFIGRAFGTHPIAPAVSPKKTVEGLVGGIVVAILAGGVLGFLGPFDLASGLLLGVSIAAVAPLGDLAVSVIKRSIGIKDMSSILPGHGGMFDRLDAILFAVPTAWVVFKLTGLLG